MANNKYDFSGWATVNDMLCADGRTIKRDAFKDNDGRTVPLVWNHDHNSPSNVLGHAVLQNRKEGVYAYCYLNDTDAANDARILINHGDIDAMSIYANRLKQIGGDVYHGDIKELSLVLSGANPGALIDDVNLAHGDGEDTEAVIYTGENIELYHSDEKADEDKKKKKLDEKAAPEELEEPKEPQEKSPENEQAAEPENEEKPENEQAEETENKNKKKEPELKHSDDKEDKDMADNKSEKTIGEIFDTLTDEQKDAVYAIVGQISEQQKGGKSEEDDEDMKHNIFDTDEMYEDNVLSHSDMEAIMADGINYGSLRKSAIAHGFDHIDYLFPDAQLLDKTPQMITRDMNWVKGFLNATHHTPFSKIKSLEADLTADEARAKGYVKGKYKKEQVVKLLKRTTEPTTVYKKQKMDRDDVIDITDFDVVAWLKAEMRVMLDEEIARAALIGDGRDVGDDDKIDEDKIRPIATDEDLYTIKAVVKKGQNDTETIKNTITTAVKARKDYRGTGNPTLYAADSIITEMSLLEDSIGRRLYDTDDKIASAMRVKNIVPVPVLEDAKVTINGVNYKVLGVIVNPADYNMGADKGGAVSMFDDFDIDYNKQIYLIETRLSGALIKAYSAIVLLLPIGSSSSDDDAEG